MGGDHFSLSKVSSLPGPVPARPLTPPPPWWYGVREGQKDPYPRLGQALHSPAWAGLVLAQMPFFRSQGRAVLACGDGEEKQRWGQAGATDETFHSHTGVKWPRHPDSPTPVRAPATCISLATLQGSPG